MNVCTNIHLIIIIIKKIQLRYFDTQLKNREIGTEMQVSLIIFDQRLASA
jgi:hypothetical protein